MFRQISGVIAFICFASITALPWWILANGRQPGWLEAGAFITWLLIGTLSVAHRDSRSRRNQSDNSERRRR